MQSQSPLLSLLSAATAYDIFVLKSQSQTDAEDIVDTVSTLLLQYLNYLWGMSGCLIFFRLVNKLDYHSTCFFAITVAVNVTATVTVAEFTVVVTVAT